MLPTTDLTSAGVEPECTYEIHAEGPDGPLLRYAAVGDKAYHVWKCTVDGTGIIGSGASSK